MSSDNVQVALGGGDSQQLAVLGPLHAVQAALVVQVDDGKHLLQVCQVVDLDAEQHVNVIGMYTYSRTPWRVH